MNYKKGFTIIELLMVIAIIGIIASIMISNLGKGKNKGTDGAITKQVTEIRSQAELHFINNGNSYLNVCTSGTNNVNSMLSKLASISGTTAAINSGAVQTTTTTNCNTSVAAYAVSVKLKDPTTTTYLCTDSINATRTSTTPLPASQTFCP
ncbi:prepilin-type N-terminal cleavage/methylation domain-containing protein [Candidatus Nomurabacteria bacterium]|nr:prepilin-type N-terminal cleavage/methylation domain-containing protein [Candidatus Nomurabacteria bacterium]